MADLPFLAYCEKLSLHESILRKTATLSWGLALS